MQPRTKSEDYIDGKPQFVPIIKWYEFLQDIEFRFVDAMEQHNIDGMMVYYRYILTKVRPYIKRFYVREKEKNYNKKLSLDEIYNLKNQIRPGSTDHVNSLNSNIYQQIDELIMEKMDLLQDLIARAKLQLPIEKPDTRPAALAGDDW